MLKASWTSYRSSRVSSMIVLLGPEFAVARHTDL
jgi:hypothetical protein